MIRQGEDKMRSIEEVKEDLRKVYETVQSMFEHWDTGMHHQFMVEMWNVYDFRQELVEITGNREEAHKIVSDMYRSVFRVDEAEAKSKGTYFKMVGALH
jgi:hypothetical protein